MADHDKPQTSQTLGMALLKACNISPRNVVGVELLLLPGEVAKIRVTHCVPEFVNGTLHTMLDEYELVPKGAKPDSDTLG